MTSKSERQHILAQIWSTPTPYELDFLDKGKEIIITSNTRDVVDWWMKILRSFFDEQRFVEKAGLIKCRPAPNITIKINKLNGAVKVYGRNFWGWFVANFQQLLEQGTADMESLSDGATDNSVTRFLQLDKNYDEVQDLLDTIPEGGGIMAHDFILRLWKALLDDWFGVGASVYIVTPKIDPERLFNICLLMLRNKGTGFRVTLVTPQKTKDGEKFAKIFDTTKRLMKKTNSSAAQKKRLVSDVKMQWILETLTIRFENFSTNFVAAFKDEEAEVMCTTAYFHKSHLQFEQKDNVSYSKLPTSDLRKNYLLPLGIGNLGS